MLRLIDALKEIHGQEVVVFGDTIFDRFINSVKQRPSSEDPSTDIMVMQDAILHPGGAGNVAYNIACLGGKPILVSVVGNDHQGRDLTDLLQRCGVDTSQLIIDPGRPTTVKTRIVGDNGKLLLTLHEETTNPVKPWIVEKALESIRGKEAVIVTCDYHRGMITPELVAQLVATGNPVIGDIRPRLDGNFDPMCYQGAFLLTPNRNEARILTGRAEALNGDPSVAETGLEMANTFGANVLITRDGDGMTLATKEGEAIHFKTVPGEVKCVSGAGDTVNATIALATAAGIELPNAVKLSGFAAAVVVAKPATACVSLEELETKISEHPE